MSMHLYAKIALQKRKKVLLLERKSLFDFVDIANIYQRFIIYISVDPSDRVCSMTIPGRVYVNITFSLTYGIFTARQPPF